MRKWRPCRATKVELLEFIDRKGMVWIYQLEEYFGYGYQSALNRLHLLKKQRLATSDGKGHWVLTEEGIRRLRWLKNRQRRREESSET